MIIVQVISTLSKGGAERLVVDLCNSFCKKENTTVYLCVFHEREGRASFKNELDSKVNYIFLNKKGRFDIRFQFRLFKFLSRIKPDVVNSHLSGTLLYLYFALLFFRKIKFFHTIHNIASEETPEKFLQRVRRYFYKKKLLIPVSISSITERSHTDLYHVRSEMIYNGVERKEPTTEFQSVKQEIASYKKDAGSAVFLSIGRINSPKDQKNYKLLVQVFKKLEENNVNAVLIIIGVDNSTDKATLNALLGLNAGNVFFIGSKSNICDYMLNSDFYCLSSKYEGLPITIIEALSYGLPVLSTNVGGISELVTDQQNGLLINSLDTEEYYNGLVELMHWDKDTIRLVSKNNVLKYDTCFSIDIAAKNYLDMYLKHAKN